MKVNEWINQKFWKSIFIRLTPSVEHAGRIRVQQLCPQICDRGLNVPYICIYYDIDIAIALKLVWRHNWLIRKTSAIQNWAKPKLIVPIQAKETVISGSVTQQPSLAYSTPIISGLAIIQQPSYKLHSI